MEKKFTCIIPARFKSTRFNGKPLYPICGKPMIQWVAEHSGKASLISKSVVATDDEQIYTTVTNAGYEAEYTNPKCPNGSARVAEVAEKLNDEWIFEMQGDQPLVTPAVIDDFLKRAWESVQKNPEIDVVIPYAPTTDEQTKSLDVLKVVKTESDRLVFQTRQPIQTGWRTLGLYLWKREALQRFASLPVSNIEKTEDSHPIRLYVNDFYVHGLHTDTSEWVEVDRENQVAEVEALLKEQGLAGQYE